MKETAAAALDDFFVLFQPSLDLVNKLIQTKSNPQEILILLCARLDGLASSIVSEDTSNRVAFTQFLISHGGNRDLFGSVSMGDLYYELAYHRWMLPGTIPKPGRLHRFSRVDDAIIHLLDHSNISLTLTEADRFLARIMTVLAQHFRVKPGQRLTKPMTAKPVLVEKTISDAFHTSRQRKVAESLSKALQPLIESKKIAALLYERFRNQAIHGASVLFNYRKFFKAKDLYWEPESAQHFGSYLLVEFPAKFLVRVLQNCMTTYRAHLLAKGKFPPDVHFHIFGDESFDYLEFLDQDVLPKGRDLKFG